MSRWIDVAETSVHLVMACFITNHFFVDVNHMKQKI